MVLPAVPLDTCRVEAVHRCYRCGCWRSQISAAAVTSNPWDGGFYRSSRSPHDSLHRPYRSL